MLAEELIKKLQELDPKTVIYRHDSEYGTSETQEFVKEEGFVLSEKKRLLPAMVWTIS